MYIVSAACLWVTTSNGCCGGGCVWYAMCAHTKNCIMFQINIFWKKKKSSEELYLYVLCSFGWGLPASQPSQCFDCRICCRPDRLHVLHGFRLFLFCFVFIYRCICICVLLPLLYIHYSHSMLSRSLAVYYAVSVITDEQPYLSHSHSEFDFALLSYIYRLLSSLLVHLYLNFYFIFLLRQCSSVSSLVPLLLLHSFVVFRKCPFISSKIDFLNSFSSPRL